MAGHFVPVYPFWTILSKVPFYNRLYNVRPSKHLYRHLICADFTDNGRYMIQNIIFGDGGTFCPGLPFSDHFDKGTCSRFLGKMFSFVLVPRNLIMSKVQQKIIFAHSSHRLILQNSKIKDGRYLFSKQLYNVFTKMSENLNKMTLPSCVCLSLCQYVSRITYEVMNGFQWNFYQRCFSGTEQPVKFWGWSRYRTRITIRIAGPMFAVSDWLSCLQWFLHYFTTSYTFASIKL